MLVCRCYFEREIRKGSAKIVASEKRSEGGEGSSQTTLRKEQFKAEGMAGAKVLRQAWGTRRVRNTIVSW